MISFGHPRTGTITFAPGRSNSCARIILLLCEDHSPPDEPYQVEQQVLFLDRRELCPRRGPGRMAHKRVGILRDDWGGFSGYLSG